MSLVRRAQDLPSRVHVSCNTQGCVSGLSRPFPGLLWVWSAVVIAVASHGGTGVGGRGIQGKARSCLQSVTSLGRHNRTAWRHWAEQRGDANNGSCSVFCSSPFYVKASGGVHGQQLRSRPMFVDEGGEPALSWNTHWLLGGYSCRGSQRSVFCRVTSDIRYSRLDANPSVLDQVSLHVPTKYRRFVFLSFFFSGWDLKVNATTRRVAIKTPGSSRTHGRPSLSEAEFTLAGRPLYKTGRQRRLNNSGLWQKATANGPLVVFQQ